MPNNKDKTQSDMKDEMGNDQPKGKPTDLGEAGQAGQATGTKRASDCDDPTTSGGREGQFSDANSESDDQWSPGSGLPSDQ